MAFENKATEKAANPTAPQQSQAGPEPRTPTGPARPPRPGISGNREIS